MSAAFASCFAPLATPPLTVAEAPDKTMELAYQLGTDQAATDDQVLEEKLRKAIGVSVAGLPG